MPLPNRRTHATIPTSHESKGRKMTLDEAIDFLTRAGLVVEKLGGLEQRILGGTARLDGQGEEAYKGAFSIGRCDAGWELVSSGPDGEASAPAAQATTLEEIVRLACERLH